MEFDYELTKEDIKNFNDEFKKHDLMLEYLKTDKSFWTDLLLIFLSLSILAYIKYRFLVQYFGINVIAEFVSGILIGICIVAMISTSQGNILPRTRLSGQDIKGKISLSYENVNIYGKKKFFSFNTLMVKKVFETENFYSILVKHYYPCYTCIIIPKRLFKTEEERNQVKEFIQNYMNKEKILKPRFLSYCLFSHIGMFALFVMIFAVIQPVSDSAYDSESGIGIIKNPIMLIHYDSAAEKAGLETGDKIVSVNGKKIKKQSPAQIINMIKNTKGNVTIEVEKPTDPKNPNVQNVRTYTFNPNEEIKE